MSTKVLLKSDGIYTYDDFKNGKASLRLIEFNSSLTAMPIRRTPSGSVEMYLVSKAWMDARALAYAIAIAPTVSTQIDFMPDDYLSKNLSNMADLILGRAQTKELIRKVALEGLNLKNFKSYAIIGTKEFFVDDSDVVAKESSTKRHGNIKAYLIHKSHYAAMFATPTPGSFVGTGNGKGFVQLHNGAAVAETITLTATSATAFAVAGSVSGALGVATVGDLFDSPQFSVMLIAGSIPFAVADLFTLASYAVVV